MTSERPSTGKEFIRCYPRITSYIILQSLGYVTPTGAAIIGLDGMNDRLNYCEWTYTRHHGNAKAALKRALGNRRHHTTGYLADYRHARRLVDHVIETSKEPMFAIWS